MEGAFNRVYRPNALVQYIGNTKLKQEVNDMLRSSVLPQVILLEGHAGCGKTTMARLIGKEYNCENRDPLVGACGQCDYCKAFDAYIESGDARELPDLSEHDSSKIGKEDALDIIEEMSAPSLSDNWKVYIFDECHLLTAGAMGGLLKAIEEPPPKVLIIFCTTNPERMLSTILSRCQRRFKVMKPSRLELCELLASVCKQENVKYEDKALSLTCTMGNYVPRDTLIALERVVRSKGEVSYANAIDVFGTIADSLYFDFFNMLSEEVVDIYKYVHYINDIKSKFDLKQFLDGVTAFLKRGIFVYNGVNVDGLETEEIKQYQKIFSNFSASHIAFMLNEFNAIAASSDVEVRLLLMGYTGVKKKEVVEAQAVLPPQTNAASETAKEKNIGMQTHHDRITPTQEEVDNVVKAKTSPLAMEDMLALFGSNTKKFVGDKTKL